MKDTGLRGFIAHAALSPERVEMKALQIGGITDGLLRKLADEMKYVRVSVEIDF